MNHSHEGNLQKTQTKNERDMDSFESISKASVNDAEGIQSLISESSKGMLDLCGWSETEIANHFSVDKNKKDNKANNPINSFTDSDILFVAKNNDGKIIGFCYANKQEDKNIIEGLYISSGNQRAGLGKKLFDEVYGQLDLDKDTFLDVFSLNSKAIGFYKKVGFSETGKVSLDKRFINSNGEILQVTEMMLPRQNKI